MNQRDEIRQIVQSWAAPGITGCPGAGGYLEWAKANGFTYVVDYNTNSSAGDWQFLVSKDGKEWRMLEQENNYPHPGFSCGLWDDKFYGTLEQVCAELEARFGW